MDSRLISYYTMADTPRLAIARRNTTGNTEFRTLNAKYSILNIRPTYDPNRT
jgi:hypothetical protein